MVKNSNCIVAIIKWKVGMTLIENTVVMKKKTGINNQIIYTIIFLIFSLKSLLSSSYLFYKLADAIDPFFTMLAIALVVMKLWYQKFYRSELFQWGIIGLCCVITSLIMKDYNLIITFLLLFSIKNVKIDKVLRVHMLCVSFILAIHIIYFFFMWIYNKSEIPLNYRDGEVRYGFYMIHPNSFSMYLTWVSLEWIYLHIKKIQGYQILLLLGINLLCYHFADSRSSLITLLVTIGMLLAVKYYPVRRLKKMIYFIAKYGFGIGTALLAFLSFTYTHVGGIILILYQMFDNFMSRRLMLSTYVANVYGLSFLGRQVTSHGKIYWNGVWFDTIYLDSAYTALLFGYGVVYAILFSVLFYYTAKRISVKKQIFFVAYLFYSFMENYGLNASSCFVPLIVGEILYRNQTKESKIDEDQWMKENVFIPKQKKIVIKW